MLYYDESTSANNWWYVDDGTDLVDVVDEGEAPGGGDCDLIYEFSLTQSQIDELDFTPTFAAGEVLVRVTFSEDTAGVAVNVQQLASDLSDLRGIYFDWSDSTAVDAPDTEFGLFDPGGHFEGLSMDSVAITEANNNVVADPILLTDEENISVNAVQGTEYTPYDAGMEIGTPGAPPGGDDIVGISFRLNDASGNLNLSDLDPNNGDNPFDTMAVTVRLTSVHDNDGGEPRDGSLKLEQDTPLPCDEEPGPEIFPETAKDLSNVVLYFDADPGLEYDIVKIKFETIGDWTNDADDLGIFDASGTFSYAESEYDGLLTTDDMLAFSLKAGRNHTEGLHKGEGELYEYDAATNTSTLWDGASPLDPALTSEVLLAGPDEEYGIASPSTVAAVESAVMVQEAEAEAFVEMAIV